MRCLWSRCGCWLVLLPWLWLVLPADAQPGTGQPPKGSFAALLHDLQSADSSSRAAALRRLPAMSLPGDDISLKALARLLEQDNEVARAVRVALTRAGKRVVPALAALLVEEQSTADLRSGVIHVL